MTKDAGVVSGLLNTPQQVGGALGLAVLATLSIGGTDVLTAQGTAQDTALVDGPIGALRRLLSYGAPKSNYHALAATSGWIAGTSMGRCACAT